jgi:mannose-6-phosphate isomerase-like protein (cupin superfamily)
VSEDELILMLQREGFSHCYVCEDGPMACYKAHEHPMETAHIILRGEMTVTMDGKSNTHRAGDRCDVPPNVKHSAVMGPLGCRYLVGER